MIEELIGFIGLSSDGIEAESGLYVDSLPDISASTIDRLKDTDGTISEEWRKIEKRTLLKFRTKFIQAINKCHKVHDIAICECLIISNKMLLATALWYLLGAEVMLERSASSRVNAATIDRSKQKELREYLEKKFEEDLEVAVNSIDIHNSECFPAEEEPEERPLITTVYPCL